MCAIQLPFDWQERERQCGELLRLDCKLTNEYKKSGSTIIIDWTEFELSYEAAKAKLELLLFKGGCDG